MGAVALLTLLAPLAAALQLPRIDGAGLTRRGVLAGAAAFAVMPAPFAALADVRGANQNMCASATRRRR